MRDLQDATTKRQALLDQYADLQEQLDRITAAGQDGACPTCSRPLGKDFEPVLGVLGRQLEEVKFNGKFYRQRLDQLEDEPLEVRELERQREQAEAAAEAASAALSRLEAPLKDAPALRERRARQERAIAELQASLQGAEGTYDPERHKAGAARAQGAGGEGARGGAVSGAWRSAPRGSRRSSWPPSRRSAPARKC